MHPNDMNVQCPMSSCLRNEGGYDDAWLTFGVHDADACLVDDR